MLIFSLSKIRAFTLVETLIALMIFLILSTTGIVFLSQASKADRKVEMEEYLYTETQALIERMRQTVQGSAIDYEEYYSHFVMGESNYGISYGLYHANFFDPITGFETGQNPFSEDPEKYNAVCVDDLQCSSTLTYHQFDELYLLSPDGTMRTYFVLEYGAMSMVELKGFDEDKNGLIDTWRCPPLEEGYECTKPHPEIDPSPDNLLPNPLDLTDGQRDEVDFMPISSSNITITDFKVYLSPIEDPYKAYHESSDAVFNSVQNHPKVIIRLTAEYRLLDPDGNEIPWESSADSIGEAPSITLQTSINTGFYGSIPSYAP